MSQMMRMGAAPGRAGTAGPAGTSVPAERARNLRATAGQLWVRLRPERARLLSAALLGLVSVGFSVAGPKIIGRATNVLFAGVVGARLPQGLSKAQVVALLRARGDGQLADMLKALDVVPGVGVDLGGFGAILGVAALVYAASSLFAWLQGLLMAGLTQRAMFRLRAEVGSKLDRLPLRYFDSHPHGDVLSRVSNDIDNLTTALQQGLSQLLTSMLSIVGVLGMMLWISPVLALVSVVVIPLAVVSSMLIGRRSQVEFTEQWSRTGDLNTLIEESHTGHTLILTYGRRRSVLADFRKQNGLLRHASFRAQFLSGAIQPVVQFLGNLNYVAIAVIGGYKVASGSISLGDVQAFIQYSRQFTMPIVQIAGQMNMLQSGAASAERVFEFLGEAEEVAEPPSPSAHPARAVAAAGAVRLEHVSFRYDAQVPLIEDLSLTAEPGQTVAIVGPTGAGKTTLVNLLMRFYEIDAGRILLDGVDYRCLTRAEVRSHFSMVLQDTWLFAGTIRENIAYGREGASEESILAAAKAARLDHFVRTLPDGYDTVLDETASNLSAGQRQLLTIARAFLADRTILILDEATSSVDTRTEALIRQATGELRQGRTSFVIAHRLSTVRHADTIVVMADGAVVEQGTHDELLARRGAYFDLYESQFSGAVVAPSA